MAENDNSLQSTISRELSRLVEPMLALRDGESVRTLLLALGWNVPSEAMDGLSNAQQAFDAVATATDAAIDAAYQAQSVTDLSVLAQGLPKLQSAFDAVGKVKNSLTADVAFFKDSKIADDGIFFARLGDHLVVTYLSNYYPRLYAVLVLAGLIHRTVPGSPPPPYNTPEGFMSVDWEAIPKLFTGPADYLAGIYQWGMDDLSDLTNPKGGFQDALFFNNLLLLTRVLGISGGEYLATDNISEMRYPIIKRGSWDQDYEEFGIALRAIKALPPQHRRGLALLPYFMGAVNAKVDLGQRWELTLAAALDSKQNGIRLDLRPGETPTPTLPSGIPDASLSLQLAQRPSTSALSTDIYLIGEEQGAFFFRLRGMVLRVTCKTSGSEWVTVDVDIADLTVSLTPRTMDGFLAQVLPADGLTMSAGVGMTISNTQRPRFRGSGGLEMDIPINKNFGIVNLLSTHLALRGSNEGIETSISMTGSLQLGPFNMVVDRIGLKANILFVKDHGPSVVIGFKPPEGAGLSIDAKIVSGGGYLFFRPEEEEYGGVFQLEFASKILLTVVGLLTTRMPDGSKGFSLLLIIAVEGFTPIQLTMGFTLSGVGGLLGVNRSARTDILRDGVRTGMLNSVLFPKNAVKNAPQIISNLRSAFPPVTGQFLIGPAVIIGWGTPNLVTLEIGLVLELPSPVRLIILGRLRALLPKPDAAIVKINMDAIGIIDFDRGEASLDATIYDSQIGPFALTGDMAMRLRWSNEPVFLLSLGGWHPKFIAPAGFPSLNRLALSLATSDNPRLRLESYLAITSNTVQTGARIDVYAKMGDLSVAGFGGFDVLIHFSPFQFQAEMYAGVALRLGNTLLMGLDLWLSLTGPNPYCARGEAAYKVFGLEGKFEFGPVTFGGDGQPEPLPEPVDAGAKLLEALGDIHNWSNWLPAEQHPIVTLQQAKEPKKDQASGGDGQGQPKDKVLVNPLGGLAVRQQVVPLGIPIDRFGNVRLGGAVQFDIEEISLADTKFQFDAQEEHFAIAQFKEMSDDEKLSKASFEKKSAGARVAAGAQDVSSGTLVTVLGQQLKFRTLGGPKDQSKALALEQPVPATVILPLYGQDLIMHARSGAAARAAIRNTAAERYKIAPLSIAVRPPRPGGDGGPPLPERIPVPELVDRIQRNPSADLSRLLQEYPDLAVRLPRAGVFAGEEQ